MRYPHGTAHGAPHVRSGRARKSPRGICRRAARASPAAPLTFFSASLTLYHRMAVSRARIGRADSHSWAQKRVVRVEGRRVQVRYQETGSWSRAPQGAPGRCLSATASLFGCSVRIQQGTDAHIAPGAAKRSRPEKTACNERHTRQPGSWRGAGVGGQPLLREVPAHPAWGSSQVARGPDFLLPAHAAHDIASQGGWPRA